MVARTVAAKKRLTRRRKRPQLAAKPDTSKVAAMQQDLERILARLDAEIPEAQKTMDKLLSRLRTSFPIAA